MSVVRERGRPVGVGEGVGVFLGRDRFSSPRQSRSRALEHEVGGWWLETSLSLSILGKGRGEVASTCCSGLHTFIIYKLLIQDTVGLRSGLITNEQTKTIDSWFRHLAASNFLSFSFAWKA